MPHSSFDTAVAIITILVAVYAGWLISRAKGLESWKLVAEGREAELKDAKEQITQLRAEVAGLKAEVEGLKHKTDLSAVETQVVAIFEEMKSQRADRETEQTQSRQYNEAQINVLKTIQEGMQATHDLIAVLGAKEAKQAQGTSSRSTRKSP